MNIERYFVSTGFLDMLPFAKELARDGSYNESEIVEAICMTFDKSRDYPPIKNRRGWFRTVFTEKLAEARSKLVRNKYKKSRNRKI